jgi:hypothetical protein
MIPGDTIGAKEDSRPILPIYFGLMVSESFSPFPVLGQDLCDLMTFSRIKVQRTVTKSFS